MQYLFSTARFLRHASGDIWCSIMLSIIFTYINIKLLSWGSSWNSNSPYWSLPLSGNTDAELKLWIARVWWSEHTEKYRCSLQFRGFILNPFIRSFGSVSLHGIRWSALPQIFFLLLVTFCRYESCNGCLFVCLIVKYGVFFAWISNAFLLYVLWQFWCSSSSL